VTGKRSNLGAGILQRILTPLSNVAVIRAGVKRRISLGERKGHVTLGLLNAIVGKGQEREEYRQILAATGSHGVCGLKPK
jgi:hypothetical protein